MLLYPQGTIKAAKQALAQVDAARVKAVGVSGQQHGMVVLDKQNKVLRPAKVGVSCVCRSKRETQIDLLRAPPPLCRDC